MSAPLYKTTNLLEIKRIVGTGVQPLCVELIDNKFLLFTFPATAAATVAATAPAVEALQQ